MKTNLDKYFKTSDALEKNGVWFEIADGVRFLVKPFKATNPQVKAAMANYYKPYARQMDLGSLSDEKAREIQIKLFIHASLIDWEGVEIDGAVTEYTPEVAMQFFQALPDLFDKLWKEAQDFNNYKDDVGNS